MEAYASYMPWMDKSNGHMFLRPDQGKRRRQSVIACRRLASQAAFVWSVAHTSEHKRTHANGKRRELAFTPFGFIALQDGQISC
jgi:hypothetical protein